MTLRYDQLRIGQNSDYGSDRFLKGSASPHSAVPINDLKSGAIFWMRTQENGDLLTMVAYRLNEFRMFFIEAVQPISDKGRVNQRRLNLNDWLTFVSLKICRKVQNWTSLDPEMGSTGASERGGAHFIEAHAAVRIPPRQPRNS